MELRKGSQPRTSNSMEVTKKHKNSCEKIEPQESFAQNLNPSLKKFYKFSTYQTIVLFSLIILQLTSYACKSVVAPFFPKIAKTKGVSTTLSGVIFSSYSLALFLASPFMGTLINKFGIKTILLGGILSQGVATVLLGVWDLIESSLHFTILCVISRTMEGAGAAAFYTSSNAFAAKLFPDQVNFILGVLSISIGAGCCLGPALGGVLYDVGGYPLPFYFLGGILLLMTPINYALIPREDPALRCDERARGNLMGPNMLQILKIQPIIVIGLAIFAIAIAWEFIVATMSVPLSQKFNLTASQISIFFLVFTGTYGISSLLWGYIADRAENTWRIIMAGLFVTSVSFFVLGPSPFLHLRSSLVTEFLAIIFYSIAIGMSFSPCFGATISFAVKRGHSKDDKLYAVLSAYNWSIYSFGGFIGPSVGSLLIDQFGFPTSCTVISVIFLITSLTMGIYFSCFSKPATCNISESRALHNSETSHLLV